MKREGGVHADLVHNEEISRELAQLGISCIPVDTFHYREFRYTNLHDAVAQATRDKIRVGLLAAE
jgi:ribose 5-phosphate isomerase RpiB